MAFFTSAITTLQTLVVALGAGVGVWGLVNLLEGYGNDNPGAKSQGIKQLMAGAGIAVIGTTLVPLLSCPDCSVNLWVGAFREARKPRFLPEGGEPSLDFLWNKVTEWLKEMLIGSIMGNLTGLFDSVNEQVSEIATTVGTTPQGWNAGVFSMIQSLSETVIVPIAGIILTFVMTYELIQMIIDRNNMHDFETFMFFKWIFKTFVAVTIVTNTWNIVMAVFDVAQHVVNNAAGVIVSNTDMDLSSVVTNMEARLMEMEIGPLFSLWFQSLLVGIISWVLTICIFVIVYGRMIEIYLVTSIAPIPMATMSNREWGQMGQNYLRSLFALGFQAFLIIICVAVYAVLVQTISVDTDVIKAIWTCIGYTVLLCFTLFKTSSLARSIFNAH